LSGRIRRAGGTGRQRAGKDQGKAGGQQSAHIHHLISKVRSRLGGMWSDSKGQFGEIEPVHFGRPGRLDTIDG